MQNFVPPGIVPGPKGPRVFLDYDKAELDWAYDQAPWAPNQTQIAMRNAQKSAAALARLGQPRRIVGDLGAKALRIGIEAREILAGQESFDPHREHLSLGLDEVRQTIQRRPFSWGRREAQQLRRDARRQPFPSARRAAQDRQDASRQSIPAVAFAGHALAVGPAREGDDHGLPRAKGPGPLDNRHDAPQVQCRTREFLLQLWTAELRNKDTPRPGARHVLSLDDQDDALREPQAGVGRQLAQCGNPFEHQVGAKPLGLDLRDLQPRGHYSKLLTADQTDLAVVPEPGTPHVLARPAIGRSGEPGMLIAAQPLLPNLHCIHPPGDQALGPIGDQHGMYGCRQRISLTHSIFVLLPMPIGCWQPR